MTSLEIASAADTEDNSSKELPLISEITVEAVEVGTDHNCSDDTKSNFELLFKTRYTDEDEEYRKAAETVARPPICIAPWQPMNFREDFPANRNPRPERRDNWGGGNYQQQRNNWDTHGHQQRNGGYRRNWQGGDGNHYNDRQHLQQQGHRNYNHREREDRDRSWH